MGLSLKLDLISCKREFTGVYPEDNFVKYVSDFLGETRQNNDTLKQYYGKATSYFHVLGIYTCAKLGYETESYKQQRLKISTYYAT